MKKTLIGALVALSFVSFAQAQEVRVAVAANFTAPMKDIAPVYEKATGDKLTVSFGSTGAFYAQIKNGAPFDVFLAADAKTPKKAVAEGYAVEGTEFTYAMGKLIVWSPDENLMKDEKSLLSDKIKKIAVANPKLAPYGEASYQTMEGLGILKKLEPKFVMGDNIGKTFQFVRTNNAQAGFVALSQVYKDGKLQGGSGWEVPTSLYQPIRQDAVLLNVGKDNEGAKRFLEFIKTNPEAARIRAAYGYGAPE